MGHGFMLRSVGGALLMLAFGAGCSLIASSTADQCKKDSDCTALGFSGYTCGGGVCNAPGAPVTPPLPPLNPQNTDGCESHDACVTANAGRAALCANPGPQGTCINLATDDCEVIGDYKNPDAIFIGDVAYATSPDATQALVGVNTHNQVRMAHAEITAALQGGLPGGPNGARRPLVLVDCETAADIPRTTAAVNHLVNTVRIQAAVGECAFPPWFVMDYFQQAAAARGEAIFGLCAGGSLTPRLTSVGVGDLSTLFALYADLSPVKRENMLMVSRQEPVIKADPGFPGGDMKVAVLRSLAGWYRLADPFVNEVQFNGKTSAENSAAGNLLVASFDPYSNPDYLALGEQVAAFQPQLIVVYTGSETPRAIWPAIEARWPSGVMRPLYLANQNQATNFTQDFVGASDDIRKRVIGGRVLGAANPNQARFLQWQDNEVRQFPNGIVPIQSQAYDAIYVMMYSMLAAGPAPGGRYDAGTLASAFTTKVRATTSPAANPTGQFFYTGANDIPLAIQQLSQSGSISLEGMSVEMSALDTALGGLRQDVQVWCVKRVSGNATVSPSGLSYSLNQDALTGTFDCP